MQDGDMSITHRNLVNLFTEYELETWSRDLKLVW